MENQKSLTVTLLINAIQEYDSNIYVADSSTENPLQFFLVPVSKNATTNIQITYDTEKQIYIYVAHWCNDRNEPILDVKIVIDVNMYAIKHICDIVLRNPLN